MFWTTLSVLGMTIIVLPDAGARVFSLSARHGPSTTDAIGVLLLVAGWAQLDIAAFRRRPAHSLPRGALVAAIVVGALALALIAWSVLGDHGAWWIIGALLLAAIQLVAAANATWRGNGTSHS